MGDLLGGAILATCSQATQAPRPSNGSLSASLQAETATIRVRRLDSGAGRPRSSEIPWFGQPYRSRAEARLVIRSSPSAGFVAGTKPVHIYRPPGRHLTEHHAMTDAKTDAKTESPHVAARHNRLREALRANLKRRKFQARGRADQPPEPAGAGGSASDTNDTRSDSMDQDGDD